MAILSIPDKHTEIVDFAEIKAYLHERGIFHDRWEPSVQPPANAGQDTVLAAFDKDLKPFMEQGGYQTADVITVDPDTPNIGAIRDKFLAEHTHSEDEIRYIVAGEGLFWFNLGDGEPVFSLLTQAGDVISVPAGTRHWFDLGPEPHVRAIRIFTDPAGWVANYTGSGIDQKYNPEYA